jgi:pyruvate/2-oxoglutarate dehydrogenase complex dihydrolipoamide dehydrogenase (E3) component/uncharacterized membrane protein YdjX (TVP38/TMEM64 family)
MPVKKLLLLAFVAIALLGAVYAGRLAPDDAAGLRALVDGWQGLRAENPVMLAALAFAAYVAVTALTLPLAAVMTIAMGALFGFWGGLVITSFASTLGATLSFLAARYLMRDGVRARLGDRLAALDRGLDRDGPFYLFTLRLIPVIPFFAINLGMGLTRMPVLTFAWVSQLGMLAGTAVYVNAGTQLAQLDSLSGLVSPGLLASFAVLGLFPWIARAVVGAIQRRRRLARWPGLPRRFDRNLIVIGAGSAGLVSAYIAAAAKAKVTLVEQHRMGGDCLNTGCVPSKALIASARTAHRIRHADRWGLVAAAPQVDFRAVMARVRQVIADIEPHDSVERYVGLGVEVLQGHARLIDPRTVEITAPDGTVQRLTTRAVILATGAAPVIPPLPGIEAVSPLTSDTLWDRLSTLDAPPPRLVVLGGGPIGVELAQAMARLGTVVTLVEMAPRLVMREDQDVSDLLRQSLQADGVRVLTGHKALACGVTDGTRWIEVQAEGQTVERIDFDEILVAVGRAARLKGYGLEDLGIPASRVIETDDYLETLIPGIYAAGDAAGPMQLTHAASHQAWFATVNALAGGLWRVKADYRVIPAVTFTDPEIARVGLSESEAAARGIRVEVTRYGLDDLDRAIADGAAHGFVKVLTEPGRDRILGVTIAGDHAGEMIAEYALAMRHGLGLGKVLGTVHAYPTWAEANKYAAGAWRRAHVNPRALALAERFHGWRRG